MFSQIDDDQMKFKQY